MEMGKHDQSNSPPHFGELVVRHLLADHCLACKIDKETMKSLVNRAEEICKQ